ncbi:hypothetical protein FHG87_016229 [Trinorchestia longiramus]|nr:hypothetical protein FHG87_016229 [Trinorchestia longiramus]
MNTNSLQQHVSEPTRGNNILDLVMTTPDLSINGLEVTDNIGDHQMIDFMFEVQDYNTSIQQNQVLDYKRANFKLIMLHDTQRKVCNRYRTPYPNEANEANQ